MRLIAITSPGMVSNEALILNRLFGNGLQYLHIRKPMWQEDSIHNLLSKIDPAFYPCIALHSHHSIAENYGISRIHIPEQKRKEMSNDEWIELKKKQLNLSTSVHDLAEVKKLQCTFMYCFFSPVFDSISKTGYRGIIDSGSFYLQQEEKPVEIIALGGVNRNNINKLSKMNFDGAAVLGTLWKNPEKAVLELQALQKLILKNEK